MTDDTVLMLVGVGLALLVVVLLLVRVRRLFAPKEGIPENAILVDGSNVMHWGGEASARVLVRVIETLEEEGLLPYVCFDANVGYKLFDVYMSSSRLERYLGVPADRLLVVNKGVVADEVLLELATKHRLRIVTNDRFRDWSDQYPWVTDHDRFRRGRWVGESVVWGRRGR